MSVKYRYTPICPHCRKQNFEIYVSDTQIYGPTRVWKRSTCIHCGAKYMERDVIYLGKESTDAYEKILDRIAREPDYQADWTGVLQNLSEVCEIPSSDQYHIMSGVLDESEIFRVKFKWSWNERLLNPRYTLIFEYKDIAYEIYAPMQDDTYLEYLSDYSWLARRAVDDYLRRALSY